MEMTVREFIAQYPEDKRLGVKLTFVSGASMRRNHDGPAQPGQEVVVARGQLHYGELVVSTEAALKAKGPAPDGAHPTHHFNTEEWDPIPESNRIRVHVPTKSKKKQLFLMLALLSQGR